MAYIILGVIVLAAIACVYGIIDIERQIRNYDGE